MQIVIDIDEDAYKEIKKIVADENEMCFMQKLIAKGTPLPKGHGRIVDIGKIDRDRIEKGNPTIYLTVNGEYIEAVSLDYLNGLQTIIEAEREE